MRSSRVTFCAYDKPDNVGGPPAWLQRLLPHLRTQGFQVKCLILLHHGQSGPTVEYFRRAGVPCRVCLAQSTTEERIEWILQQLREDPPDVFVPNLVVAAYWAARWIRASGIPTVGILHSDDPFYRALQERFVFGEPDFRVDALVVVSKQLENEVKGKLPDSTRIERIGYGVPIPEAVRVSNQGILRICYVGRFAEEQKRISDVTRAICRAVNEVPDCEAVLYGDGPDRNKVEAVLAAQTAHLPVSIGGLVDSNQIQELLLGFDVIVLLSDYEGLPIALMEAMACGCVPVCTRMKSGIPELVSHGENGLLVDDRGDEFVAAIRQLAYNRDLLNRLSVAARQRIVNAKLSTDACGRLWENLLKDLHATAFTKNPIRIPRKFKLGPVHPDLASADVRQVVVPGWLRCFRRSRIWAGRVRRQLLGQLNS